MPAPDPSKPVVDVEEEPPKPVETQEVETAPTPPPSVSSEDQLATKIREDFERLYGSRMKELQDGFRSIQRLNTKLQQEVETLKKPTAPPSPAPVGTDLWANVQDGQVWKSEIERLATEKAQALFTQQTALQQAQEELVKQDTIREQAKQEVMLRYPDLGPDGDPTSQTSTLFNEILNAHPEYLSNPFGPRLAMVDLKEKFRELNLTDPDAKLALTPGTNQELARRTRANLSSTPASRTTLPTSTRVALTKEEMEFCKYKGIDPVSFARNKQQLDAANTVEAT